MKVIGITGGIGSGKSTVSNRLIDLGYSIVDADKIASKLLEKNQPVYRALLQRYGYDILNQEGQINRSKVADIVFNNEEELAFLTDISHKNVEKEIENQLQKLEAEGQQLIFIDAPLLFEARVDRFCNHTWVIYADEETRIDRTIKRDGRSRKDIEAIIENQMKDEDKVALADKVIENCGTVEELLETLKEVLLEYEKLYR